VTSATRPLGEILDARQRFVVLFSLILCTAVNALDASIVAPAMPHVLADLGGFQLISWVFTAYLLPSTIVVAIVGKVSDMMGRKPFLHYQPIVSLANSEIIGFEALVRWDHPRLGLLPPDRFIAVAEENGTIRELGAWVLNRAAEQLVVWREATRRDLFMAVNVSARQLAMPSFVNDVEGTLESRPIPAHNLVLEITESVLMADAAQSLTRLRDLKELGVRIAVDDFGTGYSSLNYLRRFPVDVLKIDKAFVDEIADQFSKDTALVHTIIEIGRILGLEVVAEGIEHNVQVEALRDLGCEIGQGYQFGRPIPAAEIGKLLSKQAISAA